MAIRAQVKVEENAGEAQLRSRHYEAAIFFFNRVTHFIACSFMHI
jgi:hypothetical protein